MGIFIGNRSFYAFIWSPFEKGCAGVREGSTRVIFCELCV